MTDQIEQISLDLIDPPADAMRSQMDDEKLDELTRSIKQNGLIQPVTLRKVGGRYEVVAGHRRTQACRRAGMVFVSAIVRELDDTATDTIRVAENLYREDVNPVDEARYIRLMVDKHGATPEGLAEITGKSVQYLQSRYDLLDYPDYLVAAIEAEQVSLTAAAWLVRITDDQVRKEYTHFAVGGGITAKRAEAWYTSWKAGSLPREASSYVAPPTETSAEPRKLMMPCVLCRNQDDIENMQMYYAHRDCAKATEAMQING